MSRPWDFHDFNDPDDDPVTRFRHLAGDYGPQDPIYWEFDDSDELEDDMDEWDSDDSFSQKVCEEFENDQKEYPRNHKDKVRRTPAGPMISLYDTRYFVPQWDEQMLGPAWRQKRGEWDFDNPPKPLPLADPQMKGAFKYCEECQLTWLVGYDKLEGHKHPHHYSWEQGEHFDHHRFGMVTEASLVIHVRGDCISADQQPNSIVGNTAGFGVFFGKDSKYNLAMPHLSKHGRARKPNAESAELRAIDDALCDLKYRILKDRKELFNTFSKGKGKDTAKARADLAKSNTQPASLTEDTRDDDELEDPSFRVIFVSDNAEVIDNICKHIKQWKEEDGKLYTEQGEPVKNGGMYQELDDTLSELEEALDTTMKWYCVPEDHNKEAMELAQEALKANFTGSEAEI